MGRPGNSPESHETCARVEALVHLLYREVGMYGDVVEFRFDN